MFSKGRKRNYLIETNESLDGKIWVGSLEMIEWIKVGWLVIFFN